MTTNEAKEIWVDGRISQSEVMLLQSLLEIATAKYVKGELPWHYQNEKITFDAATQGTDLHIFYGWNYPPEKFWSKETKDYRECELCDPDSTTPKREVWCEKRGYNYPKCPYGCPTVKGVAA